MAPIMSAYLAVQHESKGRSIRNRQEELIKEWGSDVKGQFTPAPEEDAQGESAPEAAGEGGGAMTADDADDAEESLEEDGLR